MNAACLLRLSAPGWEPGLENLEEAQEERDEEPAEETELRKKKKKKGFTATFRRAVNAVRRHFTSRASHLQG
ncbi:unnamed protein product [Gadus morhua 'NCC']